ncbi:phenylacetate--CoA ligase [Solitalea longa]|uniref:Phenylacetate--CoA ligase n=1 Tax=Solitalea longa TaxID=2079460 RepID=A0A2S5A2N7_9SPHI|nr:AMP-binding protein [Solitalea longa]POY36557.1 phenylacetate--CoA ligase [Solitalea longa]
MQIQEVEFQSREAIRAVQSQKLVELLRYLSSYSPFYKALFAKHQVDVTAIKSLDDLELLPLTTKEDLQQFNDDFLCVDKRSIIEYVSTSGTLGSPVTIALTEKDLQRLATNEYNSFRCANSGSNDIFQLMLTLDRQFMAGMAYYSGIRKLGAGIIRLGPGVPALQWETILRLKPTAIVAVPSFILKLIDYAQTHQIDINATSVKKAICIGEAIRNADFSLNVLGKKITSAWNIQLFSTYASTEMQTAFTECNEGKGGHLQPELLIVELLDENNRQVKAGELGEVTITTLGVEGMPLLRYKTGDICTYYQDDCSCGRHSLRLSSVLGRKRQMIKFKGTTLYPPALFDLLNDMEEISDYVAEVFTNEVGNDEVLLHLSVVNYSESAERKVRGYLQAKLRVTPEIRFIAAAELQKLQFPETSRKPIRFIDRRKQVEA